MKIVPILALAVAAAGTHAQQLRPQLDPGLWRSQTKILINGRDMFAEARALQEREMAKMSPAQRAQVQELMKAAGPLPGGSHDECLTPKDVADLTRPDAMVKEMSEDAPECQWEPAAVRGSTAEIKGRCADADGFTGDMVGTITIQSPKAWTFLATGKGRMAGGAMPGGAKDEAVELRMDIASKWVAASCGAVKPKER